MALLNENYLKLKAGYLFPEIGRRVKAFCEANPEAAKRLIRCGIGDVTEPLPAAVVAAMHKAVDEMATRETFKGYGPEQGYEWLRSAIAKSRARSCQRTTPTCTGPTSCLIRMAAFIKGKAPTTSAVRPSWMWEPRRLSKVSNSMPKPTSAVTEPLFQARLGRL